MRLRKRFSRRDRRHDVDDGSGSPPEAPRPTEEEPAEVHGERSPTTAHEQTGAKECGITWLEELPQDVLIKTMRLREMLDGESDPVERHFVYLELERCLWLSRGLYQSAQTEFEQVCGIHDEEMAAALPQLGEAAGGIPALPLYNQMVIVRENTKDTDGARWWAERGLELYGDTTLYPNFVADLKKRAGKLTPGPNGR